MLQALAIRKRVLGEQHPDYAISVENMAYLYHLMGDYGEAEQFLFRARDIHRRTLGEQHPEYAIDLIELARLYLDMGEYGKAEPVLLQARDIRKKALGEQHPDYAASLRMLGALYLEIGEYAKAEPLLFQARDIAKKALGEHNPCYASSLSILARLYSALGEYAKAEPLFIQVCGIYKKALGEQHPEYAASLSTLAGLYESMGEYAKAEPLLRQARDIDKKALGEQHPEYAGSLNNLARLYLAMEEYAKAEPLLLQARDISKKVLGEQHFEYAASLEGLAWLHLAMGEFAKAEPLFLQVCNIRKKMLGERHPDYANSLNNLAGLYESMGQYAKAADLYQQADKIEYDLGVTILAAVSEAQALNYAAKELGPPSRLMSAWRHTNKPDDELYACVWMRRGLIQQITAARQQRLHEIVNADVRQQYQHYQDTRRSLARLILAPVNPDPNRLAARRKRIEELSEEKEGLERQLAADLPEFRRQLESERRPHTDLTAHLPADAVFVDILRYQYFEQKPEASGKGSSRVTPTYAAFLVRPGAPAVRVELGPAAPINAAIARWHEDIADRRDGPAAAELRRLVWEPIEKQLPPGTKTAYLCPDDKLTAIPWAALPGRKAGTVLLEEYALAVVPNGQFLLAQLTLPPQPAGQQGELLAVGDVTYDSKPVEIAPRPEWLASRAAVRGETELFWPPLPGSKRELDTVTGLAGTRTVAKLDGASAGTTAVLAKLPEARWAHFATHGFFADPKFRSGLQMDEKAFEQGQALLSSERRTVAGRNPLVLSGLVLAGANLPREKDSYGITQGDGGILTAESIAGLPLDKLELAVLSACETGLGDVAGGEGVFGLQRAFHSAGARNVVASLWKVNDKATAALMGLFYRNLWAKQLPPLEALRQAQLQIYRHPELIDAAASSRGPAFDQPAPLAEGGRRTAESPTAPTNQWAAFVLSGAGR